MKAIYVLETLRVEQLVDLWKDRLGFRYLGLDVTVRCDQHYAESSHFTCADTEFDWEYRAGAITFYLPACCPKTEDELSEIVVHELIHVMLAPMEDVIKSRYNKQIEFAVETVARAILHFGVL